MHDDTDTKPSPSRSPSSQAPGSDSHSTRSMASTLSNSDKVPVELWSLVVSFLAARRGRIGSPTQPYDDPFWRRDVLRLAHTCRAAYAAAFATVWADLRLQFIRHDLEMTLELAKIANAVEEDVHVEDRLKQVRLLRRKFDLSLVAPASKRRANKELVKRVEQVSECPLVAPLCIAGGRPYLASLVEREAGPCHQVSSEIVANSVHSLWAPHMPPDWQCEAQVTANGLVLIPYPLHLIHHIGLNDFDASVDLGVDLFPANLPTHRRKRQSWKHVLPFLLHLPNPTQVRSIQLYINSNSTHRLYLELINAYPHATDLDIAFAGDHEHRVSRFTPAAKRIRLHLDGDLDDFGDTPDLFYTEDEEMAQQLAATALADTQPKPIYPEDALPFAVTMIENHGRTSYLPYDEEDVGMQFLYVIPTLTRLAIDIDFEWGNSDYGTFPIVLPALKELTLCMRIADLIFSRNNLSSHLRPGQVAFPTLESLTLVNDLDQARPPPTAGTQHPNWPPLVPDIPGRHMPMLSTLFIPPKFRNKEVHCSIRTGWMAGVNLSRYLVPNVAVMFEPQYLFQAMSTDEDFGNIVYENDMSLDSAVPVSMVPCRSLRKLTLNVHDSILDPLQTLPGLSWGKLVEDLCLSFTGSRTLDPTWTSAVTEWPRLRSLTLRIANAAGYVHLFAQTAVFPHLVQLTLDMPDASIDLSRVSRSAFPELQHLALNVARTCHLSCDMLMNRLTTLTLHDAPCPLAIAALLACAPSRETCRVLVKAPVETDPELLAVLNRDGSYRQSPSTAGPVDVEWTYRGTPDNVRMWYTLLQCAPCVFGAEAAGSKVTVRVMASMDAVDAKLVSRVVRRLLGHARARVRVELVVVDGVHVDGNLLLDDPLLL